MRIRRWQVEGFGVFHDYDVSDLPNGLVLVHGPNEAGKSTLLAFLRGVLFGFSDRRSSESLYPPLNGGRHGGAVFLETSNGTYRIERLAGRRIPPAIVRPDGSEGDLGDMNRLLGGADETLFRSVFAFSLDELTELASLSSEGVRARIFSAGVAGAGRSARQVIDDLDREAGELLKPRSGRIRELSNQAAELRERIAKASAAAARYPELLKSVQDQSAKLEGLRSRSEVAEGDLRRIEKLIELWPIESELQGVRQGLESLPMVMEFPEGSDERLTSIINRANEANSALDREAIRLSQLQNARETIHLNEGIKTVAKESAELASELAAERERLGQIAAARATLGAAERASANAISELGLNWDERRLNSFDVSLPAVEEVRAKQHSLQTAREDVVLADKDLSHLDRQVTAIDDSLGRFARAIEAEVDATSAEQVQALKAQLQAIVASIKELMALGTDALTLSRGLDDAIGALLQAERQQDRSKAALVDVTRTLDSVLPDSSLELVHLSLGEVSKHIEVQRQRLTALVTAGREVAERQATVDSVLGEFGPGWDDQRVRTLRCDFEQVRQLRQIESEIAAARTERENSARAVAEIRNAVSGRQKDLERFRTKLGSAEPLSVDELGRQSVCIRRIRTNLSELANIRTRQQAQQELKQERLRIHSNDVQSNAAVPGWLIVVSMLFGIAALGSAIWRFAGGDVVGALILATAGVGALALGALLRLRSNKEVTAVPELASRRGTADIDTILAEMKKRELDVIAEIATDAESLGLTAKPTAVELENRDERRERDREERRKWDEASSEIARLQSELGSWRESQSVREQTQERHQSHERDTLERWTQWSRDAGLPEGLTPGAANDFLQRVRAARDRIEQRDTARNKHNALQSEIDEWQQQARELLAKRAGGTTAPVDGTALLNCIDDLSRECSEDAQLRASRSRLMREIKERERDVATAAAILSSTRAEAVRTAVEEFRRVGAEWAAMEPERKRRRAQFENALRQGRETEARWLEWKEQLGVDRHLSPDGVLDFFNLVRAARTATKLRDDARGGLESLESASREWQQRALRVAGAAGLDVNARSVPDELMQAIRRVTELCVADSESRREVARLSSEISNAEQALEDAKYEKDTAGIDRDALLKQFGASSEADFRTKLATFKARHAAQRRADELEGQIFAAIGRGDDSTRIRTELTLGRVSEWDAERLALVRQTELLREEQEIAIRVHQDLTREREALEGASDVANLELECQSVESELATCVDRWKIVRIARAMVHETLAVFQRTRQPQVLAAASELFNSVTEGRYPQILQSEEGNDVAIIDGRGGRHSASDLSRGTREQLYLCIRLGLAGEFGRRAESLPLVMDDVLVNFDAGRARRMAVELLAFAKNNQVLLFTCHESTRDMLLDIDDQLRVIELPLRELPTGARLPSQDSAEEVRQGYGGTEDAELVSLALSALEERELSSTELAERLGCPQDRLKPIIKTLRASGTIEMLGSKRGARYRLSAGADGHSEN